MNTAEYIIKRLEELGVNDFFGVSGNYNFNLLYAINNNPGTKWIGCTNELNAGYAADGYARIKGYGAIITTYGSGELTSLNAIAGSSAENVPVAHIIGLPSTKHLYNGDVMHHGFQNADYEIFMKTASQITGAAVILNKDNAKQEIDRLFRIMIKEKKPVYIAIPSDIALLKISDTYPNYEWSSDKDVINHVSDLIADKISASKTPVIIGDALIKRFNAEIEYKEFIKHSGIPVSNLPMGINTVDMDYEKYLGGYFGDFRNPIAKNYIDNSDCLIAIGVIPSDLNTFSNDFSQKINNNIAIYGNSAYIDGKLYKNIKMADLLEAITDSISPKNIETDIPNTGYKNRIAENIPLTTDYIYSRIQEFLKENDIVISDTGSVMHGVIQMKFPQNTDFENQALWSAVGWATPAAFGACIAKPQSRVILITGDGAHNATAMEVGTMLRYGVKPIIIIINNNGYAAERLLCKDAKDNACDISKISFSKFVRVFDGDVWSTKVSSAEDFDKALKVTQIINKLCYIEVCIDSLDTPLLTQDVIFSMKEKYTPQAEESKIDYKNIDELLVTSSGSGFEYETVVHKGIQDNSQNDEVSNNG